MTGAISVEAGVTIDLATKGDVDAGFDRLFNAIPKGKRRPLLRRIPRSDIAVAATPLVLNFGSVPAGYTYELTHCVVHGADAATVLAGASAALYIGSSSMYSLGNLLQPGIAVPGFWNFGGGVVYGHFGDEIFVVITGAAGGANAGAVLTVLQHSEDSVEAGGM